MANARVRAANHKGDLVNQAPAAASQVANSAQRRAVNLAANPEPALRASPSFAPSPGPRKAVISAALKAKAQARKEVMEVAPVNLTDDLPKAVMAIVSREPDLRMALMQNADREADLLRVVTLSADRAPDLPKAMANANRDQGLQVAVTEIANREPDLPKAMANANREQVLQQVDTEIASRAPVLKKENHGKLHTKEDRLAVKAADILVLTTERPEVVEIATALRIKTPTWFS